MAPAQPDPVGSPGQDQWPSKVTPVLDREEDNLAHNVLEFPTARPLSWILREQALPLGAFVAVTNTDCRQLG